jgi:hypothetical protein
MTQDKKTEDEIASEIYLMKFGPNGYSMIDRQNDSNWINHKRIFLAGVSHRDIAFQKLRDENEKFRKVIEYYADEKNYYLQKDPVTLTEVRRSIELSDTESWGYQYSPESPNILQVSGGKRAREVLAKYPRIKI